MRIVKVARRKNGRDTGFAHAGLRSGSSRMRRKSQVRFLGERAAATPLAYPTSGQSDSSNSLGFKGFEVEPTVRIELTTRALRKRCSTD